jgi:hypothetical protein
VPEPAEVCDIAVLVRLVSNTVDRVAITEGATTTDDNLMIMSSRAKTGFAVPIYPTYISGGSLG